MRPPRRQVPELPHSPDERVNIASVGRTWEYLKEVLKNVPEK